MNRTTAVNMFFSILIMLLFFIGVPTASSVSENNEMDVFILNLQTGLKNGDIQAYLALFQENLKVEESRLISGLAEVFPLENTSFFKAHSQKLHESEYQIYLQVLFQNPHSVLLENWQLKLQKTNGGWLIKEKTLIGVDRNLYKIQIPGERVERARSVEIRHVDIRIRVKDAVIFYDNVPGLETALLVLGKGEVLFSPSSPREKHQLELSFGDNVLKDELDYVYVRSSQSFFDNNIELQRKGADDSPVTSAERNKAGALFKKFYSRSFTIENSLTGGLLSFLPKGEEAIIEFKGNKRGELAYIYSPFAEEEISLYNWKENRIISLYSPPLNQQERKLFVSFEKLFDIENYQIDIHFNPKDSYISGKAKIYLKSNVQSLDGIKLKFNPGFEILRINDTEGHELFYSRDKIRKFLYIYFQNPPSKNDVSSIEVYYRGKIVPEMFLEDVISPIGYQDSYILSQPKFKTYLYTRSSFWYPSPSDEDYFNARLKIIVPPNFFCVASGLLIGSSIVESLDDVKDLEKLGSTVFVFQSENPLKYLAFIVGEFDKIEEIRSVPLLQYFRSDGVRAFNWNLLDETKEIIDFYQKSFGDYPYKKLSIVHRYWRQQGGHSPPSFIVLNEVPRTSESRRFLQKNSPVDLSRWKEYFLAHEIAHQWWGQGLSWGSYQDQWLSEGLAQFAAILYLREKYGQGTYGQILKKLSNWTKKKSEWGPITLGSRISYLDFEAYQAIVYDKSALIVNMLMDFLGEDVFFQGLQEFFHRFKYSAPRTHDFFRVFQQVSGKDLRKFFDGWFKSNRLPDVKIKETVLQKNGGYQISFNVVQLRGVFEFPLWIEWQENGKTIEKMLHISHAVSNFDFNTAVKPAKIRVNSNKAVPGTFH
ncbi:MAG: hypothetical protein JXB23_17835 [Candidatus Aminicenantes bacterium]|nr:hypothetical protein [Candidatus Aminicenantes bacterium]